MSLDAQSLATNGRSIIGLGSHTHLWRGRTLADSLPDGGVPIGFLESPADRTIRAIKTPSPNLPCRVSACRLRGTVKLGRRLRHDSFVRSRRSGATEQCIDMVWSIRRRSLARCGTRRDRFRCQSCNRSDDLALGRRERTCARGDGTRSAPRRGERRPDARPGDPLGHRGGAHLRPRARRRRAGEARRDGASGRARDEAACGAPSHSSPLARDAGAIRRRAPAHRRRRQDVARAGSRDGACRGRPPSGGRDRAPRRRPGGRRARIPRGVRDARARSGLGAPRERRAAPLPGPARGGARQTRPNRRSSSRHAGSSTTTAMRRSASSALGRSSRRSRAIRPRRRRSRAGPPSAPPRATISMPMRVRWAISRRRSRSVDGATTRLQRCRMRSCCMSARATSSPLSGYDSDLVGDDSPRAGTGSDSYAVTSARRRRRKRRSGSVCASSSARSYSVRASSARSRRRSRSARVEWKYW